MQSLKPKMEMEEEEANVLCVRCSKTFYNHVALKNHLKLQHGVDLLMVDPASANSSGLGGMKRTRPRKIPKSVILREPQELKKLMDGDFDYVIVKTDLVPKEELSGDESKAKKKKVKHTEDAGDQREAKCFRKFKQTNDRSNKLLDPSVPLKCLQPSTTVPDSLCNQKFETCCEYSIHFRREHTKRSKPGLRCQVCEKHLEDPIISEVAIPQGTQCIECREKFADTASLEHHVRSKHIKPKPFRCRMCMRSFTQQGGLQQHMRIHTGDRPYICPVCNKSFTQQGGLLQHMRTHTGDRPFVCSVCRKSFTQQGGLTQHMRTHTGDRPYVCAVCQKAFTQQGGLQQHMRMHTGHRPFNCDMCDKAFTQKSGLDQHQRMHASQKPEVEIEVETMDEIIVESETEVPAKSDEVAVVVEVNEHEVFVTETQVAVESILPTRVRVTKKRS